MALNDEYLAEAQKFVPTATLADVEAVLAELEVDRVSTDIPEQESGSNQFDFYRCYSCGRLITQLEEKAAMAAGTGQICPCGSRKFNPSWPVDTEWGLPRVVAFGVARYLKVA